VTITAVGEPLKDTRDALDMLSTTIHARDDTLRRRIREATEIQYQAPTLNRDSDPLVIY